MGLIKKPYLYIVSTVQFDSLKLFKSLISELNRIILQNCLGDKPIFILKYLCNWRKLTPTSSATQAKGMIPCGNNKSPWSIEVIDLLGRKQLVKNEITGKSIAISKDKLSRGMYCLIVQLDGRRVVKKISLFN